MVAYIAPLTEYFNGIERYKQTGDYRQLYLDHHRFGEMYWKDRSRKNYEADLWYNRNRNEICLGLTLDKCRGKRVLSIGGADWIEKEFLDKLGASEVVRTDLIGNEAEGIIEANAEALQFTPESFDVVIAREIIEHVEHEQPVFAEIRRVLIPEGLLLITTPNGYHQPIDGIIHQRAYTPESFLRELDIQGFKVISKAGNLPYILTALLPISNDGFPGVLDEFQRTHARMKGDERLYYIGTQLFVLAGKV